MTQSDSGYTKLRVIFSIFGLVLYVVDIGTDIILAVQYFGKGELFWSALTILFVFVGTLGTQIFSYIWYRDDMNNVFIKGEPFISGMSKSRLIGLHIMQIGVFTRYYHLLKRSYQTVWSNPSNAVEGNSDVHLELFRLATDLSMLKLFETFLESAPQILLQFYIIMGPKEQSIIQYITMAFSFFSISWALVDYRRCHRRSLLHINVMPSGLPTTMYLLYKLLTITTHLLSLSLLIVLSCYSLLAMTFIWVLGIIWAYWLRTDFCTSRKQEWLYRAIVGVILIFTFFNIKGQDTKIAMYVYYVFYTFINISGPVLHCLFRPEAVEIQFPFILVITGGTVLGLSCLIVYYTLLHPRGKCQEADEVDGLKNEPETTTRIDRFLQL